MSRIEVLKTYKIYIGGSFPRTESGRYYPLVINKKIVANLCLSSAKDFKNAVVSARNAQGAWAHKSAYNRNQILYRIAEVLEGRKAQFVEELELQGIANKLAHKEVDLSIDRLIYYAGWCDKYTQLYSSVNPVSGSFFNFSVPEPMGCGTCATAKWFAGISNSNCFHHFRRKYLYSFSVRTTASLCHYFCRSARYV